MARIYALLHHFFRHAMGMKFIHSNPTQNIKKMRVKSKNVPRFLTKKEVAGLLKKCGPVVADIVSVLLNTGLRWGELRNREWSNVDWNETHAFAKARFTETLDESLNYVSPQ